jgi:arylsulfatase A-like enzyme
VASYRRVRKYIPVVLLVLAVACKGKTAKHDAAAKTAEPDLVETAEEPIDAAVEVARPEHAVFKLVDNRHMAHRSVGDELVLDATNVGFARYTRFGVPVQRWHMGGVAGNERVSFADSLASIDVPIIPEQPAPTQITVRVNAVDKQALDIRVNGQKPTSGKLPTRVALEAGWQTVAFPVEPGRIVAGENTIAFQTIGRAKQKLAFSWIRIGATHPPADENPLAAATFHPDADAIELAERASLTWYVTIPDGANLVGDVGGACAVEVGARAGDASFVGGLLDGDENRVDLSNVAGKTVRLTLTARDCPRARILHPRITLHGPEPQALPPADPPRYVIMWVMDALRADKIPLFTPGARAQTPVLDELAKSSTVFRQFYVQGNESQTSHASFWTSLYPAVHGVRTAGNSQNYHVPRKAPILGDLMTAAGLFTAAITANGYVEPSGGYARGFKDFRNLMHEPGSKHVVVGKEIVDAVIKKLGKLKDNPTFMFMGTIDTHAVWTARKPWIDIYSPPPYSGPFTERGDPVALGFRPGSMGCHKLPSKKDIERLRAIYDSGVSYQDDQLGRLVAQLKSWGIWDQTMLIVTADHGEEFFEDTRCGHGGSLRDSLIRVPLLIHDPARFPGGTIVDEGVEGVDLLPSLLTSLGQPLFDSAQGQPLEPLAQGIGRGWQRPSYTSMYEYAHAMRIGRWKLRVGVRGAVTINDFVDDPLETKNYAAIRPIERRMLTDNLSLFLATRWQWKKLPWGVTTAITTAGAAALDELATR